MFGLTGAVVLKSGAAGETVMRYESKYVLPVFSISPDASICVSKHFGESGLAQMWGAVGGRCFVWWR